MTTPLAEALDGRFTLSVFPDEELGLLVVCVRDRDILRCAFTVSHEEPVSARVTADAPNDLAVAVSSEEER